MSRILVILLFHESENFKICIKTMSPMKQFNLKRKKTKEKLIIMNVQQFKQKLKSLQINS